MVIPVAVAGEHRDSNRLDRSGRSTSWRSQASSKRPSTSAWSTVRCRAGHGAHEDARAIRLSDDTRSTSMRWDSRARAASSSFLRSRIRKNQQGQARGVDQSFAHQARATYQQRLRYQGIARPGLSARHYAGCKESDLREMTPAGSSRLVQVHHASAAHRKLERTPPRRLLCPYRVGAVEAATERSHVLRAVGGR